MPAALMSLALSVKSPWVVWIPRLLPLSSWLLVMAAVAALMPAGWTPAELLADAHGKAPVEEYEEERPLKKSKRGTDAHLRRRPPAEQPLAEERAEQPPAPKPREALTSQSVIKAMEAVREFATTRPGFKKHERAARLPAGACITVLCQVFYE